MFQKNRDALTHAMTKVQIPEDKSQYFKQFKDEANALRKMLDYDFDDGADQAAGFQAQMGAAMAGAPKNEEIEKDVEQYLLNQSFITETSLKMV